MFNEVIQVIRAYSNWGWKPEGSTSYRFLVHFQHGKLFGFLLMPELKFFNNLKFVLGFVFIWGSLIDLFIYTIRSSPLLTMFIKEAMLQLKSWCSLIPFIILYFLRIITQGFASLWSSFSHDFANVMFIFLLQLYFKVRQSWTRKDSWKSFWAPRSSGILYRHS